MRNRSCCYFFGNTTFDQSWQQIPTFGAIQSLSSQTTVHTAHHKNQPRLFIHSHQQWTLLFIHSCFCFWQLFLSSVYFLLSSLSVYNHYQIVHHSCCDKLLSSYSPSLETPLLMELLVRPKRFVLAYTSCKNINKSKPKMTMMKLWMCVKVPVNKYTSNGGECKSKAPCSLVRQ